MHHEFTKDEADKLNIGGIYDAIMGSPIDDALKTKALAPIFRDARKTAVKVETDKRAALAGEAQAWSDTILSAARTTADTTGRALSDDEAKLIGSFLRNAYLGIQPGPKAARKSGPRSADAGPGTYALPGGRSVAVTADGPTLWASVVALAESEGRTANTAKMWMHNRTKTA